MWQSDLYFPFVFLLSIFCLSFVVVYNREMRWYSELGINNGLSLKDYGNDGVYFINFFVNLCIGVIFVV